MHLNDGCCGLVEITLIGVNLLPGILIGGLMSFEE